tara:strand:+ start:2145 stop:2435 length:291 start_codon:yes stop_codon:yes gene_type:complete
MIGVIANIKVKENQEKKFEKVAKMLVKEVNLKEKQNIYYRLYKKSKNFYVMLEGYKSRKSLEIHTKMDHYKKYGRQMAEFIDGAPEVIVMDEIAPN